MKILLADDDRTILTIAELSLSKLGGHEVVCARDGREALELAAREKPDLIILDAMMPGMDGYEACARLKADPATSGIPVIFLTAAEPQEKEKALALGARGVIAKPFRPDLLPAQVRALLPGPGLSI